MHILYVGDIVGGPGRVAFAKIVGALRNTGKVDFVVANAENAAGGRGLTPAIAEELFNQGANILTLGDHAWDQKEIMPYIDMEQRVVRAINLAPGCPGRGFITVDTPFGKISVVVFMGRVFLPPVDCPFRAADSLLAKRELLGKIILAEIHAEATSEKIALGRYLDGRVTSLVGTHTHVQTSDDTILPKGTAYITDLGMTGPKDSVLGRDVESVTSRFLTGLPTKFEVAQNDVALEGVLMDIDEKTGKARKIKRIREQL